MEARADYFLTVKENQPTFLQEISLELMAPEKVRVGAVLRIALRQTAGAVR